MPFAAENTMMIVGLVSFGVIAWLFCAFSLASLARGAGRSHNVWMVVGLLTGPVGLAVGYLYLRTSGERHRRRRYGERGKYDVPEMIRCPKCGESVPRSFDTCQFCKERLQAGRRR